MIFVIDFIISRKNTTSTRHERSLAKRIPNKITNKVKIYSKNR